jgi:hypothetical protein
VRQSRSFTSLTFNLLFIEIFINYNDPQIVLNPNQDFFLLQTIRDLLDKGNVGTAISIIEEKQCRSNVEYSIILKKLKTDEVKCALTVINHEITVIGSKLCAEKLNIVSVDQPLTPSIPAS